MVWDNSSLKELQGEKMETFERAGGLQTVEWPIWMLKGHELVVRVCHPGPAPVTQVYSGAEVSLGVGEQRKYFQDTAPRQEVSLGVGPRLITWPEGVEPSGLAAGFIRSPAARGKGHSSLGSVLGMGAGGRLASPLADSC